MECRSRLLPASRKEGTPVDRCLQVTCCPPSPSSGPLLQPWLQAGIPGGISCGQQGLFRPQGCPGHHGRWASSLWRQLCRASHSPHGTQLKNAPHLTFPHPTLCWDHIQNHTVYPQTLTVGCAFWWNPGQDHTGENFSPHQACHSPGNFC